MVYVDGNLEAALRSFKRITTSVMLELKRHACYKSPNERRRAMVRRAIRRQQRKKEQHA
jgi:ribosomal protein S21